MLVLLYPLLILIAVALVCCVIPTIFFDFLEKKKEKKKEIANLELLQRAQILQNLNNQVEWEANARNKDEGYDSYEDISEAPWWCC